MTSARDDLIAQMLRQKGLLAVRPGVGIAPREPEVRAAMARLQTMLDPAVPAETILREALRLLT